MPIRVSSLRQEDHPNSFDVVASVHIDGGTEQMRMSRFGNHPGLRERKDNFDPFLVAMLFPAMMRGEPLVIEGPVDELLLYNLRGPVQDTARLMFPKWRRISIEAEASLSSGLPKADKGTATGLSGGVDSMHLVHRHLFGKDIPEPLRLRLLMHHHVGAHDDNDALFEERHAHVQKLADRFGLPLVGVRCPMTRFYQGRRFNQNHTMRSVAAAISLDHLFDRFFFASSEEIGREAKVTRFSGISTLEPQLLPLFNTERVVWNAFGGATTRLSKIQQVLADDRLSDGLQVCVRGHLKTRKALNCGRCHKCARLLMQAEAVGMLDAVAPTFDMDAYRAGLNYSISRTLRLALKWHPAPNDVQLLRFLAAQNFHFPTWAVPLVQAALLRHGRQQTLPDLSV